MPPFRAAAVLLLAAGAACAADPSRVLLIVNEASPASREIGAYYAAKRGLPERNICRLRTVTAEDIGRPDYLRTIQTPVAECLRARGLAEPVFYLVTTLGVPLRIAGTMGRDAEMAAVDSELTLLYGILQGKTYPLAGYVPNPFYRQRDLPFSHADFPIYLVTRLAAYDIATVKSMIDRSLAARKRGRFVIDLKSDDDQPGNNLLRTAAILLPKEHVAFDETTRVVEGEKDVIGYASWGSNDANRKQRRVGFQWLPGAVVTEFVSTNGRTFERPPAAWNIGPWSNREGWWKGGPQTLVADYLDEGATGAGGHVTEPYLNTIARPDYLFPAYWLGRNLAESYYVAMPVLSWQNIVLGDPLTVLR